VGKAPLGQPDVVNGPLYPFLLAVVFGALGAKDGVVAGMSALFYVLTVPLIYLLGARLFNRNVGWVSALVFAFSSPILQYALSGRHVTLAVFLFTGFLVLYYDAVAHWRESAASDTPLRYKLALAGALLGGLYLTDPAYVYVLFVMAGTVYVVSPKKRETLVWFGVPLGVLALTYFARNWNTSGHPFLGVRFEELWMNTGIYPGLSAYRVLEKDLIHSPAMFFAVIKKLFVSSGKLLQGLPEVGSAWVLAFLLPSLLFGFRDPAAGVVRRSVLYSFLALFAAEALFTIDLSLFAFVYPALLVFAVAYLLHLLQQAKLSLTYQRMAYALLAVAVVFPLFGAQKPGDRQVFLNEVAIASRLTSLTRRDEVVLSDKPWLVAWYANRPSLWIPRDDERLSELRKRFGNVNWFYLTHDAQDDSQQWMIIYDSFRQWNVQVIQARLQRLPPPRPFQIDGKGIPLYEAL
jgi:4-amino-4-deoxy-L-arabinose transferase-like glycosyltransferase